LICSPSAKKSGEARKQAGKKEGGAGGRNFCPLALSAPKARLGWERFRRQAGGNAGRESIRKILWILLKVGSDFVQQTPPY